MVTRLSRNFTWPFRQSHFVLPLELLELFQGGRVEHQTRGLDHFLAPDFEDVVREFEDTGLAGEGEVGFESRGRLEQEEVQNLDEEGVEGLQLALGETEEVFVLEQLFPHVQEHLVD